jgi:hypothetical protein
MTLDLPTPIAGYFTADKEGCEAVSQCFTENAVVKDEGHAYHGRAAIRQWKADASTRYQYMSEPLACEQKDGKVVVASRLTGNFPGSPLNLRFFFVLEGEKIASLEIIP